MASTSDAADTPRPAAAPRFPLGQCVATPGALDALRAQNLAPWALLRRHQCGDWGDVCAEDAQQNEQALIEGARLLSIYTLPDGQRLWAITEADRSVSTLLLPEEY